MRPTLREGRQGLLLARYSTSAAQSIPHNVGTPVVWNIRDRDPWGMWDGAGRLLAPIPGWYDIAAGVGYGPNAAGQRLAIITLNGGYSAEQNDSTPSGGVGSDLSVAINNVYLPTGYSVEIVALQTAGVALPLDGNPASNYISMALRQAA